jgi:nucleoside phosphorylase
MIAIFAAMESEVLACPEWTRNAGSSTAGPFPILKGDGTLVCQTGIGREAAATAANSVLDNTSSAVVLSVGLAGGLAPGIAVGDIVVCSHVDHESHRHSDVEQSIYADQSLFDSAIKAAEEARLAVRTGTSLTVDEAAWGPAEKAAHHAWKAHDIVEMESFWIAEAASRRGIPGLAIRSVSDSSADTLLNLGVMRPDGTLDRQKLLAQLQERPEIGQDLSRMAKNSTEALVALTGFLDAFLPSIVQSHAR